MVDICVHPEFLSQSETVPGLIAVNTEDRGKLKLITVRFLYLSCALLYWSNCSNFDTNAYFRI